MAGGYTGGDQWAAWKTAVGATWAPLGVVTGGGPTDGYDLIERNGITSEEILRAGIMDLGGSHEIILTADATDLLTAICKDDGALPDPLDIDCDWGYYAAQHDDAYVTKAELALGVGDPLTLKMDHIAMPPKATSASSGPLDLTDPWNFEAWECSVLFGSDDYEVQKLVFAWEYPGIDFYDSVRVRVDEAKRFPAGIRTKGLMRWRITTLELLAPPTIDLEADYPDRNIEVTIAATNNSTSPVTVTLAVTGAMWAGRPSVKFGSKDDEVVTWSMGLAPGHKKTSFPELDVT